ncbi:MAG TPA: hypothetical protein VLT33_05675 [Labilithrix sp.]|nr:hypothetical protein [Labilithrix sp.]
MEFLAVGAWDVDGQRFEIASRPKLDSRVVLPFFVRDGELYAGVLERVRPSRGLRGAPLLGLEAIGFDFSGVDETADIRSYGRAIFTARAGVEIDDAALAIALPSMARSIGYLTELTLPLLLGIRPPPRDVLEVSWDGSHHRILFRPVAEWLRLLHAEDAPPCGEELYTLLRAVAPPSSLPDAPRLVRSPHGDALLERAADRVWSADRLAASLAEPFDPSRAQRAPDPAPEALRFLKVRTAAHEGRTIELVTPATGVAVSMLPYVMTSDTAYFVLWNETRAAALERRARQPLYDLPVPVRYANATGFFVSAEERRRLDVDPRALAEELLGRAFGHSVTVTGVERQGREAEPASSISTEVRHRLACAIDGATIRTLPEGAFLIAAPELARAISRGLIKDPVVTAGVLALAERLDVDPFARTRDALPGPRRAFIDKMTEGSVVQRRLKDYSSIENEQLQAPTYARLMTLLQHEFGLRIVFPRADKDRTFFKAAYRVFMAADRGEDRALQGLHFSHDAFHFALGNFTPAAPPDFDAWYASGASAPDEAKPEGKDWEVFHKALKHAENEATFFSFWTLYHEHLPLARHVGKLTFYEALRDLGITARDEAWEVYLAVVHEAALPERITSHPVYRERKDVAGLFDYMLGFRDYHTKDIATAWRFAVKEPYRGYTTRFGVYEHDLEHYLAHVHSFSARLAAYPPGLNPLLASCADVRVDLSLRVWDVVKALKLLRAASLTAAKPTQVADRRSFLELAEDVMRDLEGKRAELAILRAVVTDAEMTPNNEDTHARVVDLATRVEHTRHELWDRVGRAGLLEEAVIAAERTRELPR